MPTIPQRTTKACPGCGAELMRERLTCYRCWWRLPLPLRQTWHAAPTLALRRAAYRRILEHLRAERGGAS